MEIKRKEITIYSYSKVWKVEKKIYAIQNFVLPIPIDPWQLLYFGGTWTICSMVFGVLPGFLRVPVIIRSIIIPFAISKFLMTKKLDGKNPIRYVAGAVIYLFTEQDTCMERFQSSPNKAKNIKLNWNCSKGIS